MRLSALFVGALLAWLPAAGSPTDPQLLSLALPDSKVLAGINVDQARNSPYGQYLLSQTQDAAQHLQQFIVLTGFDPRRDLREIFLSSTGQKGPHSGLAVIRGAFDIAKILNAVKEKGQTVETYNGVSILSNPAKTEAVALLDSTLAIAGGATDIRAAIDRRSTPARLDPALVAKASQLSANSDAWFVSTAPLSGVRNVPDDQLQGVLQSELISKLEQVSGAIRLGSNVDANLEGVAPTAQDASALADVLRFLKNMAQMRAGQANVPTEATSLIQSINITASANVVQVAFSIPENQLERLTKPHKHTEPASRPARRTERRMERQ